MTFCPELLATGYAVFTYIGVVILVVRPAPESVGILRFHNRKVGVAGRRGGVECLPERLGGADFYRGKLVGFVRRGFDDALDAAGPAVLQNGFLQASSPSSERRELFCRYFCRA